MLNTLFLFELNQTQKSYIYFLDVPSKLVSNMELGLQLLNRSHVNSLAALTHFGLWQH